MKVVLNPLKWVRPKAVVVAPAPTVVYVDPKAGLRATLARKQTKRAEAAQALALLDSEIAALIVSIG